MTSIPYDRSKSVSEPRSLAPGKVDIVILSPSWPPYLLNRSGGLSSGEAGVHRRSFADHRNLPAEEGSRLAAGRTDREGDPEEERTDRDRRSRREDPEEGLRSQEEAGHRIHPEAGETSRPWCRMKNR